MRAAVVDARGRVYYHLCLGSMRAAVVDACGRVLALVPACVRSCDARGHEYYHLCQCACGARGCMCVCVCVCVRVTSCASMRAAVVDAHGRMYCRLCSIALCVKTPSTQTNVKNTADMHETTRFLAVVQATAKRG